MCGIAGFIGHPKEAADSIAAAMARRLRHRGPDDEGIWIRQFREGANRRQVALIHRRLAVIDPSPAGHQPMQSRAGTVVALNGEIYNFRSLREQLIGLGHTFSTGTDTEVLLAAYEAWGFQSLERLHGMYAFALWDERLQRLLLVRDRIGIKPLYYHLGNQGLVFGSELPALEQHPAVGSSIDRTSLDRFLTYGCVPGPRTIFEGVKRLMPAEVLTWQKGEASVRTTWSPSRDPEVHHVGSFEETCSRLEMLLDESIEERLVSDVPLGAFLSGGIDSSTVVALMQRRVSRPIQTFTIGFRDREFDEAPFARAIADHLKTDHKEILVDPSEAVAVAKELPNIYDEPFGDASAIPTFLVSRLARQDVTVALSGDGGDELFGGYGRYRRIQAFSRTPVLARRLLARSLTALEASPTRTRLSLLKSGTASRFADRITARFGASLLSSSDADGSARDEFIRAFDEVPSDPAAKRAMRADVRTYLVDDILTKLDRASMAVGLEARVPILDHRIVEFALSLPLDAVWHDGVSKAPLRAVLGKLVPDQLTTRPKQGFGFPIAALLGQELQVWIDRYLAPERIREEGFFHPDVVDRIVRRTRRQDRRQIKGLWHLICFERWYAARCRGEPVS